MTSVALALSDQNRFSINWIQGKRPDLLLYIGGALTGYLMMYFHAGLKLDMITVWFIWVALIDTPHFFGTYLRTYFDKQEYQARKPLLLGSLAWLLVGPALIGLSYIMHLFGFENYNVPFYLYILLFSLWAYWHVVRQHWGILALYKKKNQDFEAWDTRIDKFLLYGGLLAPFAAFIIRHPEARGVIGLSGSFPSYPNGVAFSGNFLSQLQWEHYIVFLSVAFMFIIGSLFIFRQIQRAKLGLPVNVPKILFWPSFLYTHILITVPPF